MLYIEDNPGDVRLIQEMMLLIDSDFTVLRANKATARILGMEINRIPGQPCYRLIHGLEDPPDYCPQLRVMTTGKPHKTEIEEPHLGLILDISVSPVEDDEGRVVNTVEVIDDITNWRQQELETVRLNKAIAEAFKGITRAIGDLTESRDPYTAGHSREVAKWSVLIARGMAMEESEIRGLEVCALLHDVGKVVIPSDILNKPGRLSENEWGIIREHPKTAYEVLCRIPFPWPVAEAVCQHHKRLDGTGYPRELRGDEIHPWARILAVADVVDAMSTHRPYRPALRRKEVVDELVRGRGRLYDEQVVDICIGLLTEEDKRVLVVEDEPAVLRALMRFLDHMGLEVQGFSEAHKALEAF